MYNLKKYRNSTKKRIQIIIFFSLSGIIGLSFFSCNAQSKNVLHSLKMQGITFGASETLEGYYNFLGGIRKGSALTSTLDANMNIDLRKLLGLSGGIFYIDLEYHDGDNPTDKLVGDIQTFDKHTSDPFFQVLEMYYQQKLFNDKLRIKVGKVDANSEFSVIDNGLEFISSSTQVTPTFFVFPTFPDPMPSINIFFTSNKLFYTNFAVYDANQNDLFLDFYGNPGSIQPTLHGELLISESGLTWDNLPLLKKDGNLKLGLWEHTGTFTKFDGNTKHNGQGLYLIFNQTLWEPILNTNEDRGIRMFLEYALSEASVSPVYKHIGGGIVWTGLSTKRPEDALGFTAQYASLSAGIDSLPHHYELALESFYKIKVNSWLDIKPDIQYIVHPGGLYPNALVGTLLLNIAFGS